MYQVYAFCQPSEINGQYFLFARSLFFVLVLKIFLPASCSVLLQLLAVITLHTTKSSQYLSRLHLGLQGSGFFPGGCSKEWFLNWEVKGNEGWGNVNTDMQNFWVNSALFPLLTFLRYISFSLQRKDGHSVIIPGYCKITLIINIIV